MPTDSRPRGEAGSTIIEVLVAALMLALACARDLRRAQPPRPATRSGRRRPRWRSTGAQQEMEKLHSLSYEELATDRRRPRTRPTRSAPTTGCVNGTFALQREPAGELAPMVVNGGSLYGGGNVDGGVITPGPIPFEERRRQRQDLSLHRLAQRHKLLGNRTRRRLLSRQPGLQAAGRRGEARQHRRTSGERGYVEVQSEVIDPDLAGEAPRRAAAKRRTEGKEGGSGGGGSAHRTSVTAQQFFLTDTPCAASGTTDREEIDGDHLLHNTLGTCASGPQTGTTAGRPDALLLGAPPDPAPADHSNPAALRLLQRLLPRADARHRQGRADPPRRHQRLPLQHRPAPTNPESQIHRWVTDPMRRATSR